jgi:hypothetical protein
MHHESTCVDHHHPETYQDRSKAKAESHNEEKAQASASQVSAASAGICEETGFSGESQAHALTRPEGRPLSRTADGAGNRPQQLTQQV